MAPIQLPKPMQCSVETSSTKPCVRLLKLSIYWKKTDYKSLSRITDPTQNYMQRGTGDPAAAAHHSPNFVVKEAW